ncbi:MAG: HipA domain-containing protein [Bacteroidetes bacterium]|nr:HipA domain-containing protein [Bacteroidota bacterium]MCB0844226.1 HipA domain-containing protein [Bacteroidota bacterium]
MNLPIINHCPGTLATGYDTYSITCRRRMFKGRKVSHILPYYSPSTNELDDDLFHENQKRISISGVQEKFSVILEKNKLRLTEEGERGEYILKPIPVFGKNPVQMPANEHLTMQIARQVFQIETVENVLIFFKDGSPAYLTKRFDVKENGEKWACEDFASLAGRTPQTHGENYKYQGNYLELFDLMKRYLPAYQLEAPKLFKLLIFNYLFANGDAHFKNFSIIETSFGDFRLSPAYDLLNTRIHIDDSDFALEDALLPGNMTKGKIGNQFHLLADKAGLLKSQRKEIFSLMLSNADKVIQLIDCSYLPDRFKRNYLQTYQQRLKKLQA